MEYLDLGMVFATILSPIVVNFWITMEDGYNENLIGWWNGESYDCYFILLEILATILVALITFLIMLVGYPVIIGGAIIVIIVISLRNKRVAKINKKKEN